MHLKKTKRTRRALKSRMRMRKQGIERLSVTRSGRHIYAQVMLNDGSEVVASASSNESQIKGQNNGNIDTATKVGKLIAERAIEKGVKEVAIDRSGYKFHGRVKALAMAARETGLSF